MHCDVMRGRRGRLRVCCGHYLVLVSLHTSHLKLFSDVLADGVTGCEDVSGRGERKLALHKIVFQLRDKVLIFGIALIPVLRVGPSG